MAGLISVSYFLLSLFFSLIFFLVWARIILRYFQISTANPIAYTIFYYTEPFMSPLERHIYPATRRHPRYDWVGLAVLFLLEIIKFLILSLLILHKPLPLLSFIVYALCDMIVQLCNFFFYLLLARIILSWLPPQKWAQHPFTLLLFELTRPLMIVGHKIVPNISGFDFAPFVMLVILKVITLFISGNMPYGLM